jgi:hypothetical protein
VASGGCPLIATPPCCVGFLASNGIASGRIQRHLGAGGRLVQQRDLGLWLYARRRRTIGCRGDRGGPRHVARAEPIIAWGARR